MTLKALMAMIALVSLMALVAMKALNAVSICSTSTSLFIVVSLGIHCMFEIYPQNGHDGGVDGLNT